MGFSPASPNIAEKSGGVKSPGDGTDGGPVTPLRKTLVRLEPSGCFWQSAAFSNENLKDRRVFRNQRADTLARAPRDFTGPNGGAPDCVTASLYSDALPLFYEQFIRLAIKTLSGSNTYRNLYAVLL
ncbi:Hypothetical protein CINCED_3A023958 [Cinara cedri]|uniref:Uncharacterized protein n=1 Tax=Cinara cedri TaxID=506608 RepID=A0A5E4MJ40_9HEMI|nr:Hypothetical protein CINCED_3A023958 [Cinara cedri]